MAKFTENIAHAWNVFTNQDPLRRVDIGDMGASYGSSPNRRHLRVQHERSILAAVLTRLAIDASGVNLRHIRKDTEDRYVEDILSGLHNCLNVEANLDQGARQFRQDIYTTMFDKGVAAVVPIDTTLNPEMGGGYDIRNMRVAEIVSWYPRHVTLNVYNVQTGRREDVTVAKTAVAIIENPFLTIMNEPSSTLQRIVRKLAMLDSVDEQASSGKLDLLIKVPYTVKDEAKAEYVEKKRKALQVQMKDSQYGIGYIDGTEEVIQLNRAAENTLWAQIKDLKADFYTELGITPEIMNGTATPEVMQNYENRTLEPLLDAASEEFARKFLTKTARTQLQTVSYFRNPFKLVPIKDMAEIGDKFSRNEIMTANQLLSVMGMKPSKDPKADQLMNSNINPAYQQQAMAAGGVPGAEGEEEDAGAEEAGLSEVDKALDDAFNSLGVEEEDDDT